MNFLFVLLVLAFVKNSFSSSCHSGLEILAEVAISSAFDDSSSSLTPEPQDVLFALKLSDALAKMSTFPEQHLMKLRARYPSPKTYLSFLLQMLSNKGFESYAFQVKLAIFNEFQFISAHCPEITSSLDFSFLHLDTCKGLGIFACTFGNLDLLKRLVECGLFDFNAEFSMKDFTGNAIVLLKNQPKCLAFAIEQGLSLKQYVIDESGEPQNAFSFLRENGCEESYAVAAKTASCSALKRIFDLDDEGYDAGSCSSSSFKALKSNTGAAVHLTRPQTSKEEDDRLLDLLKFGPNRDEQTEIRDIRSLLEKYGPQHIRQLIAVKSNFIERESFLPMLREVLADDLAQIAEIYAGDAYRTITNLHPIRKQFGDNVRYANFVFEFFKASKSPRYAKNYMESLLFLTDDTVLENVVKAHSYSDLPEKMLTAIAFYGVKLNLRFVLSKVALVNYSVLKKRFCIGVPGSIYSHVSSAAILKMLLDLRVKVPPTVFLPKSRIPTLYHFLSMKDPAINQIILSEQWKKTYANDALAYAQQSNDFETAEILVKMMVRINRPLR